MTNGNYRIVKKALRHRSVLNAEKYIHSIKYNREEDFEVATASTPEEVKELGKSGWTKYDEMAMNGIQIHFYKKIKKFGGLKSGSLH